MRPLHGVHGKEGWAGPGSNTPAASCIPSHTCLPLLPFVPFPLPGAAGAIPMGTEGQDRAGGTPGSPPSPDVSYSVTSDWGMAGTEGERKRKKSKTTVWGVPMGSLVQPACGPGLCPLPCTTGPSGCPQTHPCALTRRKEMGGTARMYMDGCQMYVPHVCPHMHTHTP